MVCHILNLKLLRALGMGVVAASLMSACGGGGGSSEAPKPNPTPVSQPNPQPNPQPDPQSSPAPSPAAPKVGCDEDFSQKHDEEAVIKHVNNLRLCGLKEDAVVARSAK